MVDDDDVDRMVNILTHTPDFNQNSDVVGEPLYSSFTAQFQPILEPIYSPNNFSSTNVFNRDNSGYRSENVDSSQPAHAGPSVPADRPTHHGLSPPTDDNNLAGVTIRNVGAEAANSMNESTSSSVSDVVDLGQLYTRNKVIIPSQGDNGEGSSCVGATTQDFIEFNQKLANASLLIHQSFPVLLSNHQDENRVFNESLFFNVSPINDGNDGLVGVDREIFNSDSGAGQAPYPAEDMCGGRCDLEGAEREMESFNVTEGMTSTQVPTTGSRNDHPAQRVNVISNELDDLEMLQVNCEEAQKIEVIKEILQDNMKIVEEICDIVETEEIVEVEGEEVENVEL